ncbi:MbcA/ParS/Xre antitoxin family protein [Pannonibacter phragmitetus]|uniref:MbcA/ParS/Xre antitoxin family protein n=1 Tax=Pannonibacter phragmitetus TaxID=121719 RepID=UPI000B964753|nr:MbcA/ParS/Xre antitoxin family protein [Pannonibacter phragmitetus]
MILVHQSVPHLETSALLTKAVLQAADRLGVSNLQLSAILGVSAAEVSEWRCGENLLEPGTGSHELAVLFVRSFCALDAMTGGDEVAGKRWLSAPNAIFAVPPVERMAHVQGLTDVTAYLEARVARL